MDRPSDLIRFYDLLDSLEKKLGGKQTLAQCTGRMNWPTRGIYYFFESGEVRSDSGHGLRVVRVGTHALASKSRTTLWMRLSQHKGVNKSGGGNHRGSIFRLIVGSALKRQKSISGLRSWGIGADLRQASQLLDVDRIALRDEEVPFEIAVSEHIRRLPFIWLAIDDPPSPDSLRGLVERNSISLLSNFGRHSLDPPSQQWLGHHSDRERVRRSGLWNNNYVDESHNPGFLDVLGKLIDGV